MDDSGSISPTVGILVFVILVLLDFVIFGFVAAMGNLNEAAIERRAKRRRRQVALLSRYMDKPDRYMHVCQLLTLMAHMFLGFVQVPLWRGYFLPDVDETFVSALADGTIFVALILLVLLFGIYTPQKVAARKPEVWAMRLVCPVHVVSLLFFPIIFLADALSNLLARLFGVDPLSDTDDVTEEEIISMVNEGHEQGVLLASEAEMIHNIFEFADKEAKDIMTHRKNIVALDGTRTFRQTLEFIKENNYSRFPVYLEDIDNVIGVLHIKEALELSLDTSFYNRPIQEIDGLIHGAEFIPETRNINMLFKTMQAKKNHMVVVVDEYGQTSGIVAMEDILEEIVGNIEDEHDEEESTIEKQMDGSYLMSGMASFADVMEELAVWPDEEESDDFETLNGFLISLIGKIPSDDEVFSTTAYGYLFEILSVENKIIKTVRVAKLPEEMAGASAEVADGCEDENQRAEGGTLEDGGKVQATCQNRESVIE